MVVKMSSPGRSFGGVADYCLHDPRMPGEAHHPESAERVEWTETRNLATSEGERAGRRPQAGGSVEPGAKRPSWPGAIQGDPGRGIGEDGSNAEWRG